MTRLVHASSDTDFLPTIGSENHSGTGLRTFLPTVHSHTSRGSFRKSHSRRRKHRSRFFRKSLFGHKRHKRRKYSRSERYEPESKRWEHYEFRKHGRKRESRRSERYEIRKGYSSGKKRGIHFTKHGQPYRIMPNGRARFVKKRGRR